MAEVSAAEAEYHEDAILPAGRDHDDSTHLPPQRGAGSPADRGHDDSTPLAPQRGAGSLERAASSVASDIAPGMTARKKVVQLQLSPAESPRSTSKPGRQQILFYEVLEAIVHTSGYVLGITFYKAFTAPPLTPTNGIQKEFRFDALNSLRVGFAVPMFCNLFATCTHFLMTTLYMCVVKDEEVSQMTQATTKGRTYFGLPYPVLAVSVFLGNVIGASYLLTFLYLPLSVAECIMMTGPAVSILLSSILQPGVKYNWWIWASVIPLVTGGVLVSASEAHGHDSLPASTSTSGLFAVGIFWALVAVVARALRLIVVDIVVGQYEKKLLEEALDALEGQEKRDHGEGSDDHVKVATREERPAAAPSSQKSPKQYPTYPSAVKVLQLILPFNILVSIALTLIFERAAWSPFIDARRNAQTDAERDAGTSGPGNSSGSSFWLPLRQMQELSSRNELHSLFTGLVLFAVCQGFWILTEFRLVQNCGSYAVAIFANLNRGGAALVAVIVLKEPVTPLQIVGMALIAAGLVMKFWLGEATAVPVVADEADAVFTEDTLVGTVDGDEKVPLVRREESGLSLPPIPSLVPLPEQKEDLGDRLLSMLGSADSVTMFGRQLSAASARMRSRELSRSRSRSRQLSAGTGAVPRQFSAVSLGGRKISASGGVGGKSS